ncbi:uncharacterized protein DUF1569 [Chitinophaga niastensis]|uniref:Uncharacterized protein DUF1569 n=1 Tax=Chitinophaga niastensis TaxID=536980 RepID=A0A2P8HVS7_CHINA|nr:DUF1569 domain-containing protein [Chitinophaga niastensis]PSL50341.1 uncharacterized protein DUF1569 [Chitinophaga niastensis]
MKTVFDKTTRDELINRINMLNENSTAQWGKMNLYQMVKHCRLWEEMILGKKKYKRIFMGRLLGRMALKSSTKDEKPMMHNAITIPELRIKETGDFSSERKKWIALIEEHEHFSNPDFVHPFFGKMTKEQIGYHAYKHTDHHLRQFNC